MGAPDEETKMSDRNEFWITNKYARNKPIDLDKVPDHGLRVYRDSPDGMLVQIRTHTDKQARLAHLHLNWEQAAELADFIKAEIDRLTAEKKAA